MHDAISSEQAGTPAIGVMTTAFVSGAELMADALGMRNYAFAVINHPIASATEDQLHAQARSLMEQATRLLDRPSEQIR